MMILGKKDKAIALIAVILLVLIVSAAVLALAVLLSTELNSGPAISAMDQALFAAQTGVYRFIAEYKLRPARLSTYGSSLPGNCQYFCQNQIDFLIVDADNPQIASSGGTNNLLQNIPIASLYAGTLSIISIKLEWDFGGTMNKVSINNKNVWTGNAASGAVINLSSPVNISGTDPMTWIGNNSWRFSNSIANNSTIILTINPGSPNQSRRIYLYNKGRSGNKEFAITCTGRVIKGASWKRTIKATYDIGVDRITSWQESVNHVI